MYTKHIEGMDKSNNWTRLYGSNVNELNSDGLEQVLLVITKVNKGTIDVVKRN